MTYRAGSSLPSPGTVGSVGPAPLGLAPQGRRYEVDRITQDTTTRSETRLWRPAKARMTQHWNVSVTQYDNGGLVASHARMDPASRRYVFTRLSDPDTRDECPHYLAWALCDAAAEVLGDEHYELPHL